ncbi:sensor histidine kinase [Salinisphaera aquimarina]|uniref:histidine kinase n=1 Tax=Salinisphaera aquimarina TaxID=2094031 RepID=A0ABV7ETN7_9GAMM
MSTSSAESEKRIAELQEQLQNERAMRRRSESNERCFRELAEHIREVFWMTNPLGDQLVYISPAYEHIWGQTCQSLYDDPGRRLAWVHEADRQAVLTAFKRDAIHGEYDEVFRIERPDGEMRWIRDRAFPVYDDNGEIYRLAGFALDITESIENNDRITRLHSTIDTRNRMSVFAALGTGLAHDVSQPLTAARNFIAQARMKLVPDNDAPRAPLERADAEIERAASIIRHLRDFAREGKPTRDTLSLQPLIDDVHQLMDSALRGRNIRYTGPDPRQIEDLELPVDRVFAQQILRNLVANAIDAFDDDDGSIRHIGVSVRTDEHADHVDIEVSDNGPGVAEDGMELFEPFVTTKDDGLGLGLAVCRTLARSHGGELTLSDRGRRGNDYGNEDTRTRFVLRLPRN